MGADMDDANRMIRVSRKQQECSEMHLDDEDYPSPSFSHLDVKVVSA